MKLAILFGVLLISGLALSEETQEDVKDDATLMNDEVENVADSQNEIDDDMDEDSVNADKMDESESDQLELEDENESPFNDIIDEDDLDQTETEDENEIPLDDEEDQYEMNDIESDPEVIKTEDENEVSIEDVEGQDDEVSELEDPRLFKPYKQCKTIHQLVTSFSCFFASCCKGSTESLLAETPTKNITEKEAKAESFHVSLLCCLSTSKIHLSLCFLFH